MVYLVAVGGMSTEVGMDFLGGGSDPSTLETMHKVFRGCGPPFQCSVSVDHLVVLG